MPLQQKAIMGISLDNKLVVAISSRALFDFEEENLVFEQGDDTAYMRLQLERLEIPAQPGVAFSMVKKLLAFNDDTTQRVEVVILSRNDPVSGLRVMKSAAHYALPIIRCSFTRGESPWRYLKPLRANLFLSTHLSDVRSALAADVPAGRSIRNRCMPAMPIPMKCASHLTATPCCSATRPSAFTSPTG